MEGEERPERLRDRLEVASYELVLVGAVRRVVEARHQHEVGEDENAPTMIVALRFDVGVSHKEHGENDGDDVPAGEDQPEEQSVLEYIESRSVSIRECIGD